MASADVDINLPRFARSVMRPRAGIDRNIKDRANKVANAARLGAPVGETGDLKSSIGVSQRRNTQGFDFGYEVFVDVPYALYVHEGTRPHVIRATGTNRLGGAREPNLKFFWERTGQEFIGPRVNHPGTSPQPFLRVALLLAGGNA